MFHSGLEAVEEAHSGELQMMNGSSGNIIGNNNLNSGDSQSSLSDFNDEEDDEEGGHGKLHKQAADETRQTLARQETRAVSCLRWMVIAVLLATAISVSLATFFYSRGVEYSSFEAEFASVALVTLRSFVEAVESKLSSMDAVATGITSHAIRTGEVFPNVTVPDFEIKGATVRTQTDSIYMFYLPLVTDETRAGYEQYTTEQQGQMFQSYMTEEGLRLYQDQYYGINKTETALAQQQAAEASAKEEQELEEGTRKLHVGTPEEHPVIHPGIWGLETGDNDVWLEPKGKGPYLPMWQLSPTIPLPALVNFNFFEYTDLAPMLHQTLNTGKAVLSYLQTTHIGSNTEDLIRVFLTLNQYRHVYVDYNADPMTQVAYPVFDGFHPMEKNVTGVLVTTIFWRLLFRDSLPDNVQGVICVIGNSLGEQVTYRIDGKRVSFVGTGDLHDPQYDDMVVSRDLSEFIAERAGITSSSYTTIDLDVGYTSYVLHVYPSQDMEQSYITNDPYIYAIVVAFIFVFTSAVFITYDRCVERRQKKVMDTAAKSTAVVSSLFPKAVHDRLFGKDASEPLNADEVSNIWMNMNSTDNMMNGDDEEHARTPFGQEDGDPSLHDVMQSDSQMSASSAGRVRGNGGGAMIRRKKRKGRPIADKFPSTTVLFADLAGFTQWSSTREPEDVFELLETIYGAFDKIAIRRSVFKVETIGDCYMAVTGLPNPQPDNAVRMIKFARDCMMKMDKVLENLAMSLGKDTLNLKMRVGCHSGPVTAGVLRGDKGRFQLFGDTVNTASRMESCGVKGRIHVSEACAKNLPSKWLTKRPDKVHAKGKGEMQTYFVDAIMGAQSEMSRLSSISISSGLDFGQDIGIGVESPVDNGNTNGFNSLESSEKETFKNEPGIEGSYTKPAKARPRILPFRSTGEKAVDMLCLADEISV